MEAVEEKRPAVNPFLPSWEYIPDGEPHLFDGRVYLFGSHDRFDGKTFCMNDYVCWSAPENDLGDWRYEGVIFQKDQDPRNSDGGHQLYAPDVGRGPDGRYYLYYCLDVLPQIGVAVADQPAGPYQFLDLVRHSDGTPLGEREGDCLQFDPGVFRDDDGEIYLYSGNAAPGLNPHVSGQPQASQVMTLETDMITLKTPPRRLLPSAADSVGTDFEGHGFFEASSMRKIGGRYYLIYSSANSHELCYAVSDQPDCGFRYGGTIISNGDIFYQGRPRSQSLNYIGNNHGSLVLANGEWYIFYHRHTNRSQFSRQACAQQVVIEPDGSIRQVEMTSCGLNGGPLPGRGRYGAYIACNLRLNLGESHTDEDVIIADQPYSYALALTGRDPYFTQEGGDRQEDPPQYIKNLTDGGTAGFKYFQINDPCTISVTLRGNGYGEIQILTELGGQPAAVVPVMPAPDWAGFSAEMSCVPGVHPLYFCYKGSGVIDFLNFTLR